MNTLNLDAAISQANEETTTNKPYSVYKQLAAFADSQKPKRAGWFLISLLGQGVLFLPVPAALMYYYNAPIVVLVITLVLFFANIISGMGGSKIGVLITLLALSIVVHLAMIMVFVL